jgi:hypothetical protein
LTLAIRKMEMAEEEWQIVRRVPNKGHDDMANEVVLPRAGTIASWIRNTMTEMNKAYGLAIAAFIEAGGTCPCNESGCDGDIMAGGPFVKTRQQTAVQHAVQVQSTEHRAQSTEHRAQQLGST